MKVSLSNRQRLARPDAAAIRAVAARLSALSGAAPAELTITLADDASIAPVNAAAVGHAGPTDVITLSYDAIPGDPDGPSAEIFLNVECAISQRPDDPSRELAYYLAHAFNHLAGHDDATPATRTAMHRRERRWLNALAPLPALLAPLPELSTSAPPASSAPRRPPPPAARQGPGPRPSPAQAATAPAPLPPLARPAAARRGFAG